MIMRNSAENRTGKIINKSHMLLAYADDIDIIGRGLRDVTATFSISKKNLTEVDLVINEDKNKLFVSSNKESTRLLSCVTVENYNFEVVLSTLAQPQTKIIDRKKRKASDLMSKSSLSENNDPTAPNTDPTCLALQRRILGNDTSDEVVVVTIYGAQKTEALGYVRELIDEILLLLPYKKKKENVDSLLLRWNLLGGH